MVTMASSGQFLVAAELQLFKVYCFMASKKLFVFRSAQFNIEPNF